jgi:hypothetical protein
LKGSVIKGNKTHLRASSLDQAEANHKLKIHVGGDEIVFHNREDAFPNFYLDYDIDKHGTDSSDYVDERSEILVLKITCSSYRRGSYPVQESAWLVLVRRDAKQDAFERMGLLGLSSDEGSDDRIKSTQMNRAWQEAPEIEIKMV